VDLNSLIYPDPLAHTLRTLQRSFQNHASAGLRPALGPSETFSFPGEFVGPSTPYESMPQPQQEQLLQMLLQAIISNGLAGPVSGDFQSSMNPRANPYSTDVLRQLSPGVMPP
jgi:hypothetical protein